MTPKILQNDKLRFCKIKKGTKKPFEKDWINKPYTWQEINEWLETINANYGVICGYGDLAVIDADNPFFQTAVENMLPETYRIQTGSGGTHNYFFIPDLKQKIILHLDDKDKTHLGEVQSYGTQVVAPNSIHPNGKKYKELNENEIATISCELLLSILKPFMQKEIKETENNAIQEYKEHSEIDDLSVSNIWGLAGMKKQGSEYYGSHPIHSSVGGMNFWINPLKNTWHCFRCHPKGTKIPTINGIKNIEDLKQGEYIFGKDFQSNKIISLNSFENKKIYKISSYIPDLELTEDHPILVASIKYKGKHLSKNNPIIHWKTPNMIDKKKDFLIVPKKHKKMLDKLDEDGYLIGFYLAEGHLPKRPDRKKTNQVILTLGLKKTGRKEAERLCNISKKYFEGTSTICEYPKRGTIVVSFFSEKLRNFLETYIGTGSEKKQIGRLITFPINFLARLIEGYLKGDGYVTKYNSQRVSSVSEKLIREVQMILFKLGIPARYFSSEKNNSKAKNPKHILQWQINPHKSEFQDDNYLYIPIKSIKTKNKNEKVYSIQTKDGTYLLPFIVHNCDSGGGVLSAIAVKHGIIDCSEARRGNLRGRKALECIKIAKESYGLSKNTFADLLKEVPVQNYKSPTNDVKIIWDEELKNYEGVEKEWIVENLIPTKSVCVITGKRGTLKTFLILQMIYSIASGNDFLNKYSTRKGKVIYLDKENGIEIMKQRTTMIKRGMEINKKDLPIGFICFSQLKIDRLSDIMILEKLIEEHKPILLIVDTYRRGISFDENDAGEVSKLFVDTLRPLVEKYDLSIILIHHNRKSSREGGDEMDEIRGSSDLANYSDIILKLERNKGGLILKQLKNRNAQEENPMKINTEFGEDYLKMWFDGEFIKRNASEKFAEDVILWATKKNIKYFETKDIKELALQNGVKKNNMHNALMELQSRGVINSLSYGKYEFKQV